MEGTRKRETVLKQQGKGEKGEVEMITPCTYIIMFCVRVQVTINHYQSYTVGELGKLSKI